MRTRLAHILIRGALPASLMLLAACAPAPIYKPTTNTVAITPDAVAHEPEHYANADVIWGGRIVGVHNLPDRSEIEIVGYPLDSSQRPKAEGGGWGRFIAVMPGFVEPYNYPSGALITLAGRVSGSRAGEVGEASYVYPLVGVVQSHLWTPAEMHSGHPNISFGLGVGVGIH
ncbi:Slp family lipoprotein [Dyella halodurans]|uniref:Slp family lipoprotein n=1 Tax=Dyella halodurans TaxID=1920171 RepID=A0ABV9C523_9GAMM|nr:Slp family lipoprotein [Dyella halodurans]